MKAFLFFKCKVWAWKTKLVILPCFRKTLKFKKIKWSKSPAVAHHLPGRYFSIHAHPPSCRWKRCGWWCSTTSSSPKPNGPSADPHARLGLGHVLKHTEAKTTLKTKQHQKESLSSLYPKAFLKTLKTTAKAHMHLLGINYLILNQADNKVCSNRRLKSNEIINFWSSLP